MARSCVRIISKGKHPSIDAIYEDLGRIGSRSTIHKHRQTFLEQFEKTGLSMLPSALPESLIPAFEEIWSQAILHAGNSYQEHEAEYEKRIADSEQLAQERAASIADLEKVVASLKQDIRQAYQEREDALDSLREAEAAIAGQKAVIESLRSDKDALNEKLADERREADRRYDLAHQDWLAERATFKETIDTLKQSSRESEEKQERLTDYWTMQVADARDQVAEFKQQMREAKEAHHADLQMERTRIAQLSRQNEQLTNQVDRLQRQLDDCVSEKAEQGKELHHLREAGAALARDLEESERVRQEQAEQLETVEQEKRDLQGRLDDIGGAH